MSECNGKNVQLEVAAISANRHDVRVFALEGDQRSLAFSDQTNLRKRDAFEKIVATIAEEHPALLREDVEEQLRSQLQRLIETESQNGQIEIADSLPTTHHFSQLWLPDVATALAFPWVDTAGEFRYFWAVQWVGGEREILPVAGTFPLPGDDSIYVQRPDSEIGTIGDHNVWRSADRVAWLDGKKPPTTKTVLRKIAAVLRDHVSLSTTDSGQQWAELFVAAWILQTYIYRGLLSIPYLHTWGPRNSGKSQLLEIVREVGFLGEMAADISASSLFRLAKDIGPTFCIDEAERVTEDSDLSPILNAGYRSSGTATRTERTGDGEFTVRQYPVFCPKVLASINPLNDVVESRCLQMRMLRAASGTNYPEPNSRDPHWAELRDLCYRWSLEHGLRAVIEIPDAELPDNIHNRDAQLWRPISYLMAEGHDPVRVHHWIAGQQAERDARQAEEALPEVEILVLRAIYQCVAKAVGEQTPVTKMPRCRDIVSKARALDPSLVKQRNLTSHRVSKIAKKYGLRTEAHGNPVFTGTVLRQIDTVRERYGVAISDEETE